MLEKLYPSPEARGLVLMLCHERLGVESYTHIIEPQREVPSGALEGLQANMERLRKGEPIQYVLGYAWFRDRKFKVGPSVLIPRPETQQLVDLALDGLGSGAAVLDLCTGSGCIAWSIALEAGDAAVTGVDISDAALEMAESQMDGAARRPVFLKADVLEGADGLPQGPFDLITSNPPYVMESEKQAMRNNVLDYEPGLALFVPDNDPLLFYKAIVGIADRLLRPGGKGVVEINEALSAETAALFSGSRFENVCEICDYFGKKRFISFQKRAI